MPLSPQQQKLRRLALTEQQGVTGVLVVIDEVETSLGAKIDAVEGQLPALREAQDGHTPQKGKDYFDGEDGHTPVKGKDYFDGKDYVLTEKDRKAIAKTIEVPIVEKVVETIVEKHTEVIREMPIVTNEIVRETTEVEVAVLDEATIAYLEGEIEELRGWMVKNRGSMLGRGAVLSIIDQQLFSYRAVTSTYTITADDNLLDCSGTFTITLPPAAGHTGEYIIKNSGNGTVTLEGSGSETIDDNLAVALNQYVAITVRSNGTNWIIV